MNGFNHNVICYKCGYQNHYDNIAYNGLCKGCGAILDGKANFEYMMAKKLKVKRRGERGYAKTRLNRTRTIYY